MSKTKSLKKTLHKLREEKHPPTFYHEVSYKSRNGLEAKKNPLVEPQHHVCKRKIILSKKI